MNRKFKFLKILSFALVCSFISREPWVPQLCGQESRQDETMDVVERDAKLAAELESRFLTKTRQLTVEGRRAGEGYFSKDGRQMVFQSEREKGNPFYQIYVMDFDTGDLERISPGQGKTTCAWIHPDGNQVLFASTHEDPDAVTEQEDEIRARLEGTQRRYS